MSIKIQCAECGKSFSVKDEYAGKKAKCPCGAKFVIPEAESQHEQYSSETHDTRPLVCVHCKKEIAEADQVVEEEDGVFCKTCHSENERTTRFQYRSFAKTLSEVSAAPVPHDWTYFRSDHLLFELWYPSDWAIDTGEHLILRPDFAEGVWETDSHMLYSPAITLLVGSSHDEQNEEALLATFGRNLSGNFKKFRMVSEEELQFRGSSAACFRFLFERADTTWEAFMLLLPFSDRLFILDASGRATDVMKHYEVLERVVATLRTFSTRDEFEKSVPKEPTRPNLDPCPESNVMGVLFSIGDIKSACYGKVIHDEFFKVVDAAKIGGTRISIGDILPAAEFFCVKLETPDPSVAQYVRQTFGESCQTKGIAPFNRRFMSGTALENQPLPEAGYVSPSGQYSGSEWY